MIFEIYIVDASSSVPYLDKTFRKTHLGVNNTLVSGILGSIFTLFKTEMEIGHIQSVSTQEFKLIYLAYHNYLFITLADIKLEESKIQEMLNTIATSFSEQYTEILKSWTNEMTIFKPFIKELDRIVIDTIANLFLENYPQEIVSLFSYIRNNYALKYQEMIGKALAEKLRANRYGSAVKMKNLRKELSRFTVVQISSATQIELSVCPFCRKEHSQAPICNFVTGFINGMLGTTNWQEKLCVAQGDDACSFSPTQN
ncbi:MAG: hypothetical protein ACTSRS_01395 [Candidatus Helarchaeota archaeon]